MLYYENINKLNAHCTYIQKKLKSEHIFLVGGCVRDLLLDINKDPKDIDFTMQGIPKKIYNNIDTTNLSHFMTEKFGTITLIPKKQKSQDKLQYELTPLREEDHYTDKRHPEEIIRSTSILADAKRRDFSINCIYYFSQNTKTTKIKTKLPINYTFLNKEGFLYIPDHKLRIIQDHVKIETIFPKGKFSSTSMKKIITQRNSTCIEEYKVDEIIPVQIIIDPYQGIQGLQEGKLKCVGEADKRFGEDALRIVRALRIPNVINHKLLTKKTKEKIQTIDYDTTTRTSLKKNFFLVQFIAKERIKDEMIKVFKYGNPFGFISLIDEVNLLKSLFPSLYANKNINQPVRYHPFDVYTHTLLTLFELQKINNDYLSRFAMLYHDVGKADQYYMYKLQLSQSEVRELFGSWLNHQKGGIDLTRKDFEALKFSKKEIDTICRYVEGHHKPGEILDAKPQNRIKKMRKLLSEAGYDKVKNLIDICIADRRGQYNPMQNNSDISDVKELYTILDKLQKEEGQFTMKQLAISGNDIMKKLKIKPGKEVGKLLSKTFDRVINDIQIRNNKTEIYRFLQK